ncbi:MAG TPA: LamG domain-containing protein, partial [Kofleriaceae bacterium]
TTNSVTAQGDAFLLNQWQHIAVTFDGDAKKLFVNGTLFPAVATGEQVVGDSSPLLIGCDRDSGAVSRFYAGLIDKVIIYSAALSETDVAMLAQ